MQVVLKTKKAFSKLTFVQALKAEKNTYYTRYKERDTAARKSYLDNLRSLKPNESIYLIDLVRNPELLNGLSL